MHECRLAATIIGRLLTQQEGFNQEARWVLRALNPNPSVLIPNSETLEGFGPLEAGVLF